MKLRRRKIRKSWRKLKRRHFKMSVEMWRNSVVGCINENEHETPKKASSFNNSEKSRHRNSIPILNDPKLFRRGGTTRKLESASSEC